jgi:phage shock protein C
MNDRLYRSRDDRLLAGVAGGLAEHWDADPSLIRIVWALLVILTGGIALVAYIVMAIVVPEDPGIVATAGGPTWSAGVSWSPGATPPPAAPDWRAQREASRAAAREARRAARASRGFGPHTGTLIIGGFFVLIGTWFLLEEYIPAFNADLFWPLALVLLGAVILAAALRPREPFVPPPAAAVPTTPSAPPAAPASPPVATQPPTVVDAAEAGPTPSDRP